MQAAKPLAPGDTIGILGSGQLGRMLALAAARLGIAAETPLAQGLVATLAPQAALAA